MKGTARDDARRGHVAELLRKYQTLFAEDLGLRSPEDGARIEEGVRRVTIFYDREDTPTKAARPLFEAGLRNLAAALIHPEDELVRAEARAQIGTDIYGVAFGDPTELTASRLNSGTAPFAFENAYNPDHFAALAVRVKELVTSGQLPDGFTLSYVCLFPDLTSSVPPYRRITKDSVA